MLLLQSQALNDRDAMMPPSEARNNCTSLFVNMHNPPLLCFHIVPRWRRRSFNNLHLHRGHHTVEYTCDWYIMVRMDKEEEDEEMMNTYQTSYTTSILEDARSIIDSTLFVEDSDDDAKNRLVSYTCLSSSDNIDKDWNINQGRRRRIKINENGSSCACCRCCCSAVVSISTPAVVSISECPSLHRLYAPCRRPCYSPKIWHGLYLYTIKLMLWDTFHTWPFSCNLAHHPCIIVVITIGIGGCWVTKNKLTPPPPLLERYSHIIPVSSSSSPSVSVATVAGVPNQISLYSYLSN